MQGYSRTVQRTDNRSAKYVKYEFENITSSASVLGVGCGLANSDGGLPSSPLTVVVVVVVVCCRAGGQGMGSGLYQ